MVVTASIHLSLKNFYSSVFWDLTAQDLHIEQRHLGWWSTFMDYSEHKFLTLLFLPELQRIYAQSSVNHKPDNLGFPACMYVCTSITIIIICHLTACWHPWNTGDSAVLHSSNYHSTSSIKIPPGLSNIFLYGLLSMPLPIQGSQAGHG